jgi:succinate-acetate transporter protein
MASSASGGMTTGFPLALASMGISIFVWAASLGGWLPDAQATADVLFFVGGMGMLFAGIIAFRENAAFGGAANIALSAFWFGAGVFLWFVLPAAKNLPADTAWIIAAWAVFVAILTAGISRMGMPLLTLAMGLFFLLLFLLWVYGAFHTGAATLKAAGVAGIASAVVTAIVFAQQMWKEAV